MDVNFHLKSLDPWADLGDDGRLNGYRRFTTLKKSHPHLRTLLCVGGWKKANLTLRKEFATESAEFLKQFEFDGLNLLWDFPGDLERGGTKEDKENFPLLLREMSKVYRENNLYLSVTLRTKDWMV
ncbi:hypothetical protein ACKWTF_001064 [Chironomus riparius]